MLVQIAEDQPPELALLRIGGERVSLMFSPAWRDWSLSRIKEPPGTEVRPTREDYFSPSLEWAWWPGAASFKERADAIAFAIRVADKDQPIPYDEYDQED